MMRSACLSLISAMALSLTFASAANAGSNVVVSIKPIHSLVAGVMDGVGEPHLIVKGGSSPHTYALKPSDAKALEKATVVFWVGEMLERFLEHPLETLPKNAKVIELSNARGLIKYPFRESGAWERHEHEEHGDDKHDHDRHAGEGHDHDEVDMHLWLDPVNAKAMVSEIVSALVKADAGNTAAYEANGRKLANRLDALIASTETLFAPIRQRPFVVFHDAYQYLEKRFGLNAVGSITVSPEVKPGARRVAEMKKKIGKLGAVCVFSEPQFEPKLVRVVTEGTPAKTGTLDPVGSDLPDGPELYFSLMDRNVKALTDCLGKTS